MKRLFLAMSILAFVLIGCASSAVKPTLRNLSDDSSRRSTDKLDQLRKQRDKEFKDMLTDLGAPSN